MLGTNGEEQAISRVVAKVVRGWGIQFEVARPGDALRWMIGREEWGEVGTDWSSCAGSQLERQLFLKQQWSQTMEISEGRPGGHWSAACRLRWAQVNGNSWQCTSPWWNLFKVYLCNCISNIEKLQFYSRLNSQIFRQQDQIGIRPTLYTAQYAVQCRQCKKGRKW